MSLTGAPLRLLLVLAALAAIAATVLLVPRLAGRTWPYLLARFGVLMGCQVCVVAALLAMVNSYFDFYSSWGTLFGSAGGSSSKAADAPPPAPFSGKSGDRARLIEQVRNDSFVRQHKLPVTAGRLDSVIIRGESTGASLPAYVYLPPQYFQARYRAKRFPVTVAFTGYPGDNKNLITRLHLPQLAAREIAKGSLQPTIFVMLRPTIAPPRDTECVDVPRGPQAETFFAQDLPVAMKGAYRTAQGAAGWSAMGDSTGGYCAVKLAMRHSDRYGSAISLAGEFHAAHDFTTGDLFAGNKALRNDNDLLWRLRHRPMPPSNVLLTSTVKGERNYKQTLEFVALAKPPMDVASIILPSGGHHFRIWQRQLPPALHWLSQHLES